MKLIEFLKNAIAEEEYSLVIPVPAEMADNFVHRMRVELSRLRKKVQAKGRIPKRFKLLFMAEKTEAIDEDKCKIVIKKSAKGHEVDEFIDSIFDEVAGGRVLKI